MICEDLLSLGLRIGEVAFSAVVAGLTGHYLHQQKGTSVWDKKRFIYTEVIAALGILFALLFLLPFAGSFIHWPMDTLLGIAFIVAFALLAKYIGNDCGSIWNWHGLVHGGSCNQFKADLAFAFLAAIFFFVSALLGLYVMHKRRNHVSSVDRTGRRTHWYRRSRV